MKKFLIEFQAPADFLASGLIFADGFVDNTIFHINTKT